MDQIKIGFLGMEANFDPQDNFITNILKERYTVEISDDPDFLFYSVYTEDYMKYNCVKIFYTAENLVPNFNICDYGIGFHYISFDDRYFRYPLYLVDGFRAYAGDNYANDLQRTLSKHKISKEQVNQKTEFCSFVYSNNLAAKCREDFLNALSRYKSVNSGGRYKNNVGGPVDNKLEFQLKHKYSIAFENSSAPGYTTEKLIHAFSAYTIPIYWGDPEVAKVFNPNSFINCHEYGVTADGDNTEAFKKIIDRIKEIDENEDLYWEMLKTPAFQSWYDPICEQQKFKEFLFHILDQKPDDAFRRNRTYWGERNERRERIGLQAYTWARKLVPLRNGIKRVFH